MLCSRNNFHSVVISIWVNHKLVNKPGLAHFVEHLVMDGKNCKENSDLNQPESRWIDSLSATANDYYTIYDAQVHESEIPNVISFLKKLIFDSNFSKTVLAETKRVICAEMSESNSDPSYRMFQRLRQIRFKQKTFLSKPIIGTKNSVLSITHSDVKDFYTKNYTGENTVISITGHFDQKKTRSLIEETFGTLGKSQDTSFAGMPLPEYSDEKRLITSGSSTQTNFMLSFQGYSWRSNIKERLIINLLSTLLCGLRASRLFQELRVKKQLVYDIYSETVMENNFGLFNIFGQCSGESVNSVIEIILHEIDRISTMPLSDDELNWFKNYLNIQNEIGEDSLNDLAYEYVEEFANTDKATSWKDIITQRNEIVPADVLKTARGVFNLNKLNIIVLQ